MAVLVIFAHLHTPPPCHFYKWLISLDVASVWTYQEMLRCIVSNAGDLQDFHFLIFFRFLVFAMLA